MNRKTNRKPLDQKFTFLLSSEELSAIDELAERLERTKSDAVRFSLRQAIDAVRKAHAEATTEDRGGRDV